jgi:spore coat polysaccharide biosynthesis protein SpsF (cytidylyltransferase family)
LVEFLEKKSIDFFRGSEYDVMDRVLRAAKQFNKKKIVSLTGDCPLIDSKIIESMIKRFDYAGLEYMSNFSPPSYPDGMEVQIFSNKSLEKIENLSRSELECEHVGLVVRNNLKLFRSENFIASKAETWPNLGLTLDEEADAILIRKIVDYFHPNLDFSCASIIEFLKENRELISINSKVERR